MWSFEKGHSLFANMSTGEPSASSHGQPLNCQAGPWTNTATTRSLQVTVNTITQWGWSEENKAGCRASLPVIPGSQTSEKNAHQSWGASFSGWSMIRYGTVTLRVVPPGWIWSLRLWSRTSLSRWMPCFFFSSDVTNLARDRQVKASHVLP